MAASTRMKDYQRSLSIETLVNVINNIPKFIECPINEGVGWITAWNDKFPRELVQALDTIQGCGYNFTGIEQNTIRIVTEVEGKHLTTVIRPELMSSTYEEYKGRKPLKFSAELVKQHPELLRNVRWSNARHEAMPMSLMYLTERFGADQAQAFANWAVQTAELRDELCNATEVVNDVFGMAKTAGQIKRMVPDLLQYLPRELREAYEEQKRASSMPFEWAPYEKSKVDRMILTVSKGHLLAGMAKPLISGYGITHLDHIPWGRYCDVAVA